MKISELVPEIIGKKCEIANQKDIFIIIDYIKNIREKNNVKVYNPITQEIFWVPFNLINLIGEQNESEIKNSESN